MLVLLTKGHVSIILMLVYSTYVVVKQPCRQTLLADQVDKSLSPAL